MPDEISRSETLAKLVDGPGGGNLPDPTGKVQYHCELVAIIIQGKNHHVAFLHQAYWENCFVVFDCTGPSPSEYMRFGKAPHNIQNTDRPLLVGHTYVFSAWHIEGPGGPPDEHKGWRPSHCKLQDASHYTVLVDDGLAGSTEGDFNFEDMKAFVTQI